MDYPTFIAFTWTFAIGIITGICLYRLNEDKHIPEKTKRIRRTITKKALDITAILNKRIKQLEDL